MIDDEKRTVEILTGETRLFPSLSIHALVSETARQCSDRVAVSSGDQVVTYAELDRDSNWIAAELQSRGVGPGSLVGLIVDRHPGLVVAMLAILKTGAAYLPLDPHYPSKRLTGMLASSGAELVISERAVVSRLSFPIEQQILLLDDYPTQNNAHESTFQPVEASPDDACYVIYTSGSTGQPKGVEVSHGSLVNLFWSIKEAPGMRASDVVLANASVSFDIAAIDLLMPLVLGARVEIATAQDAADPVRLMQRIERSRATMMQGTPITWRLLLSAGWSGSSTFRVWCGGEEMTGELAAGLLARSASVWNLYGPTETTIIASAKRVTSPEMPISMGQPVANTALHVFDEQRQPVTDGVAGELYISGKGLAKGYWQQPDLTGERFVHAPIPGRGTLRLYKTGDRVGLLPNGELAFLGRVDRQVKLRGFRIELGEIERTAAKLPGVQDVAVIKAESEDRGAFLAAYLVIRPGFDIRPADVRRHFAEQLPRYMVPSYCRILDCMPVSPNGKLDRNQLPAPTPEEWRTDAQEEEPHPGLEAQIAELWRAVLGVDTLNRHDKFFDLGGDSLLAAQLVAKMSKALGRRCEVSALMQAPTVAAFAALLCEGEAAPFIALNKGSLEKQSQKLFWIDQPNKVLYDLARLMRDQPFHALFLDAKELAAEAPDYRMESLAARIVKRILSHQPSGCFYVGGFCQNALLAYEVAQQLRAAKLEVPLLIMVDPFDFSLPRRGRGSMISTLQRRIDRELFHVMAMLRGRPTEWAHYFRRRVTNIRFVLEGRRWQSHARKGLLGDRTATELSRALFVSQLTYEPQHYGGRVLFIEPTLRPKERGCASIDCWAALVDHSERVAIYGDHMSLFAEPGATVFAEKLIEYLTLASANYVYKPKGLSSPSSVEVNNEASTACA